MTGLLRCCGATIRRPVFKPEQIRREQAARLRAALLPFEGEMPDQVRDLIGHIDRKTAERDAAQAEAPPGPLLRVMQGGKAE